jgi:hypothetical protein
MKRGRWIFALVILCLGTAGGPAAVAEDAVKPAQWSMNATIIEACSCPMFCQCYFNTKPAAHHEGHGESHYCKFNNAYRVNKGSFGPTKLDGAKFWIAGDLGGDFSHGEMDWAVLHFDPSVTKPQREAIQTIVTGALFPVKWNSFSVGDDYPIEWKASVDRAEARLDGGKAAEVVLTRMPGNTNDPVVIKNLKYWFVPRHDGFVLMPNEVEAYRLGKRAYEYKGSNGFMITFDMNSSDKL